MTALDAENLRLIERDRTTRERGLSLFFLALGKRALRRTRNALRLGVSWATALRDVFRGNPSIDVPDPAGVLARGMADTHARGFWRVGKMVGVEMPKRFEVADLADFYRYTATESLGSIADTIADKVEDRIIKAAGADRIAADLAAASEGFDVAGFVESNGYGAERAATTAVVTAYAAGMREGYDQTEVRERVRGLRFIGVLDERQTAICKARHNVKLPLGHHWLLSNSPPLHFSCRSTLLPITTDFEPTPDWALPYDPLPTPGFGYASSITPDFVGA